MSLQGMGSGFESHLLHQKYHLVVIKVKKIMNVWRNIKASWIVFRMSEQDILDAQERGRNGWSAR